MHSSRMRTARTLPYRGGFCPGGLCLGVSVQGGLCLEGLCLGVSVQGGSLSMGVSVRVCGGNEMTEMTIALHDNFNIGSLLRLDDCMICKFHTLKSFVANKQSERFGQWGRGYPARTRLFKYIYAVNKSIKNRNLHQYVNLIFLFAVLKNVIFYFYIIEMPYYLEHY